MKDNPSKMVEVYSTANEIEAELIRNMIESAGIRCLVEGGNQGGLAGLAIMQVRLFTGEDDQAKAKKLIASMAHD